MNSETCRQFFLKQDINPLTKRKIAANGPTHKKLTKECADILRAEKAERSTVPKKRTPTPPPPRNPTPKKRTPTPPPPRNPTPIQRHFKNPHRKFQRNSPSHIPKRQSALRQHSALRPIPREQKRDASPQTSKNERLEMLSVPRMKKPERKNLNSINNRKQLTLLFISDPETRNYLDAFVPPIAFVKKVPGEIPPDNIITEFADAFIDIMLYTLQVGQKGAKAAQRGEEIDIVQLSPSDVLTQRLEQETDLSFDVIEVYDNFWDTLPTLMNIQVYAGIATGPKPQMFGIELEWFIPFLFSNKYTVFVFILVDRDYRVDNLWKNLTEIYHFETTLVVSEIADYKALMIYV